MAPLSELRVAWLLLLLLRDGCAHGYELHRAPPLWALGRDAACTYRTLRTMETEGLIASRWAPSREGPRRRVYTITGAGRTALQRLAGEVEDIRDAHDGFLAVYRGIGPAGRSP